MKKTLIFAMLGLAAMLTLASPTQASARVVVGVALGPVAVVPHPVYHAYVYPRPYYPWAYGPVYPARYWGPYWHPRVYGYRAYVGPRGYRYYRR